MGVRRAGENHAEQPGVEHVLGIGKILRHLLFKSASLLMRPRIRLASIWSAMSRSLEGTVKKYCVTVCWVVALKCPPMAAIRLESCAEERPGLPRNIICSRACAVPGKPSGASFEPTR